MFSTQNNHRIKIFKFSLVFVILLFLLFPISFADTTIQRSPAENQYVSNEDFVKFYVNTDTPTKVRAICNGETFSDNYLLASSHTINTKQFPTGSDVDCKAEIMNNVSVIIEDYDSSDKPILKFHVYSKQPVLTITDSTVEGNFIAEFDKPKGSQVTYALGEKSFTIKNDGLSSIQNIKITKGGDLSSWTTVSPTEISSILALEESDKITVKIEIPETAQEKTYQGYIKITSNAGEKTISFSVKVVYPVEVSIDIINSGIEGMLKAGNSYESTLEIKETMGYKDTGKISVRSSGFPNWMDVRGINSISNINAGRTEDITIRVTVPERNVVPSTYNGRVTLSNDYIDGGSQSYNFNFEIPYPKMSVSKTNFAYVVDPGNKEEENFRISETDGYTPIEGLRISLTTCKRTTKQKGEEEFDVKKWIQFSGIDSYMRQGTSKDVSISIDTKKGYATGIYTCEGKVTTNYAGEKVLNVKFTLSDVSVTNTINELERKLGSATNNYEKNIFSSTKTLMEKIRADISSSDFISSYVSSFITSAQKIKNKVDDNDYDEAYKEVEKMISQENSIRDLKSNSKYWKYRTEIIDIEKNVDVYFKNIVGDLLNHFKNEGDKTKDTNMLLSVEQYNKALDLCEKISCENKDDISNKINEVNDKINSYNISIEQNKAKINTLKGEISKLLFIDLFGKNEKYNNVINYYAEIIDKREKIGGDDKNAEVTFYKTEKGKIEEEKIREVTMSAAGLLIIVISVLLSSWAFVSGIWKYRKDKKNMKLVKNLFSK